MTVQSLPGVQHLAAQPPVPPAVKPHLANVSLVCVETRYPELARYAIDRCLAAASFQEVLLLSPTRHDLPDYIRQVPIAPIDSVPAYSEFMLRDLGRHFAGEFVLVIQWDSFILDGAAWSEDFLDYDYIGAPWRHRPVAVGNGGFSLRSRRLVDAVAALAIAQPHPEDHAICELHRDELIQQHGIRFAPAAVAARFAFEETTPDSPTFGFHGVFNFHKVMDDAALQRYIDLCDDKTMWSEPVRRLIRNVYHGGRYAMARRMLRRRLSGPTRLAADALRMLVRSYWHALVKRRA